MTAWRQARPVGDGAVRRPRPTGSTLVELVAAVAITATLASIAVPSLLAGRDQFRAAGAARHLASLVHEYRSRAIQAGAHVALRFSESAGSSWVPYADGNRNGVRSVDVSRGVDVAIAPELRLGDLFPGVGFGIVPGTTDIDDSSPLAGSAVKFGAGNWLSFSPSGSASSGTLYLRGRGLHQFAVRVLGSTGRVRVLRFDARQRRWVLP